MNDDLISRQAAIARAVPLNLFGREVMIVSVSELENLPSAQPERIRGEWIELTNTNHTYICSVCGRMLVNITDGKNNVAKNYPYCHCGADMRSKQECTKKI